VVASAGTVATPSAAVTPAAQVNAAANAGANVNQLKSAITRSVPGVNPGDITPTNAVTEMDRIAEAVAARSE
jgi:hypothetical protein